MTSLERLAENRGREEGFIEGLKRGVKLALKLRLCEAGLQLMPEIEAISNVELLLKIEAGLENELSLDQLQQLYRQQL